MSSGLRMRMYSSSSSMDSFSLFKSRLPVHTAIVERAHCTTRHAHTHDEGDAVGIPALQVDQQGADAQIARALVKTIAAKHKLCMIPQKQRPLPLCGWVGVCEMVSLNT